MWSIRNNRMFRYCFIYFCVAVFGGIVTFFYYLFDRGMRDIHMTLLFLPGLAASFVFFLFTILKIELSKPASYCFHAGFPFLFVYILLYGIYAIAKTSSPWLFVFYLIAIVCFLAAIIAEIVMRFRRPKEETNEEEK